jgi:PAS domain S-box-containing protein
MGLIRRAILLIVTLALLATALVYVVVHNRERQVLAALSQRSAILASTRAEVLQTWLGSLGSAGLRLSRSDVFRLFATEAGMNGNLALSESSISAQIPYMIQVATEFARQEGLAGVYLLDVNGRAILVSSAAPALTDEQRRAAQAVFISRQRTVTSVRQGPAGLMLDVMLPVAPPQEENPSSPTNVSGVFILATPVHAAIADILAPSPLSERGEKTRVFQVDPTGVSEIVPGGRPILEKIAAGQLVSGDRLQFARRQALGSMKEVYSSGSWVKGIPWIAVHETDAIEAAAPIRTFFWGVVAVAVFVVLSITSGFVAFWWRQASEHSDALANQYHTLGARIAAQKRFLSSLMSTATEMIGLKKKDGAYLYVNSSFAAAVGRSPESIQGLDDAEVFGRGTAERLRNSDQQALTSERPVVVDEIVHLPDGVHHLQISKVPYKEANGDTSGLLMVARDVTDIRQAEERRQRGLQAMTRAFVRTIEQVDPFLSGHSQNVQEISVALATTLSLPRDDVTTLDIAAMLAQIGKLSIPREIVSKASRLTPDEYSVMQQHVTHAVRILQDVEFGLPVLEAIQQMYERLDGTGYPQGLMGEKISLVARILAVSDVFAARIEPRSYRPNVSPDTAIQILMEHPERYDAGVVGALKEFVRSIDGEKLIARIQGSSHRHTS